MIKSITYFFQSIIVYIFYIIAKIIGINLSRKFFGFIFCKFGPFLKSKEIINQNLNFAKKYIPEKNREKIINNMWKNYGMTFIEYIFLNIFKKNNKHVQIYGDEKLFKIFETKKSVIFISGHFANFELMSMEITKKNIKLATIYRPLNNYFLNPLMEYLRRKYVCKNQIKKGLNGLRDAIEYLKNGYSLAMMVDQRLSEGEKINFFDRVALTTTLPAQLAVKYNLPIVPVFIKRVEDKNFIIEFWDEINPEEFKGKLEITQKLNQCLEQMVVKNPSQWIWTHNRWKN